MYFWAKIKCFNQWWLPPICGPSFVIRLKYREPILWWHQMMSFYLVWQWNVETENSTWLEEFTLHSAEQACFYVILMQTKHTQLAMLGGGYFSRNDWSSDTVFLGTNGVVVSRMQCMNTTLVFFTWGLFNNKDLPWFCSISAAYLYL